MNREDIEKFKRHIGESMEMKLGDDVFNVKPLKYPHIVGVLTLMQRMSGKIDKDTTAEQAFSKLTDADNTLMVDLIISTICNSYPDVPKETVVDLVSANLIECINMFFTLHFKTGGEMTKIMDRIETVRKHSDENVGKVQKVEGAVEKPA